MPSNLSAALTIAGSDSGGGAGVQADLKTFAALGVHGLSVITCVTAQSPRRVLGIEACSGAIVRQQLEAVSKDFRPKAAKTGMLFSARTIREVAGFFGRKRWFSLVVDPVMVSTSGKVLLQPAALRAFCDELIPLATLLTPNLREAEVLTGNAISTLNDLKDTARELHAKFGCAILAKGGHLPRSKNAVDVFYDGSRTTLFSAPFVRGVATHGTGCTYSAAIAAFLARDHSLARSIGQAKKYITGAIRSSRRVSGHHVLNW